MSDVPQPPQPLPIDPDDAPSEEDTEEDEPQIIGVAGDPADLDLPKNRRLLQQLMDEDA